MNKKLLQLAFKDIISGIKLWRIWLMLGWQDIRLRYRRSQLGPFWITLSMAIMIYSMGFLYGKLLKTDMSVYYPFLGSGLITWALISTIITEANDAFMESQDYIKQINLPYTIYILRVLTRNFIIFFHNIIPLIPIMIYFRVHFGPLQFLFFLLGLIIILLCGLSYGTLLAMIGTRYRDIKQIVSSLIQVVFLLTPIMWMPKMLPGRYKFASVFNPFNQIIELLRAPLTGRIPSVFSVGFSLAILTAGVVFLIILLCRARHRIAFWI